MILKRKMNAHMFYEINNKAIIKAANEWALYSSKGIHSVLFCFKNHENWKFLAYFRQR